MDKIEKIRQESEELYARIDECIDTLIKARLNKDTEGEGKSLFQMEGLMVGTQQFLCWISDTLEEEPNKSLEEEAEEWAENEAYGKSDAEFEMAYKGFIAGAKWQAEQDDRDVVFWKGMKHAIEGMKKEAVEADVISNAYPTTIQFRTFDNRFHHGDKVRIIVLPKED